MKKSNLLEQVEAHADKIVLGVIVMISLGLLWMYVMAGPYGAEVDGRKRGPGELDVYVKGKADRLLEELDRTAEPMPYDKAYAAEFDQRMRSSVQVASLAVPYPGTGESVIEEDRLYDLPRVASLTDVTASTLRGAAQIPTDEIRPDNPYASSPFEMGDLDLVTVSANFNMESLVNSFQQSFMGPRLKSNWRDAGLAKPVFARLELQRRQMRSDGSWTDWSSVPRTRIDMYKKLLEDLPMTTDQLQFGVNIWINQYMDKMVQNNILQPDAYTFLISRSEWMPPAYQIEAFELISKQEDELKRQMREERSRRQDTLTDRRTDAPRTTTPTRRQPQDTRRTQPDTRRDRDMLNPLNPLDPLGAPQRVAPVRRERTLDDVKNDIKKILLDGRTSPESMREALLVWAHDDTTEPGQTYQYRLRLGVFNPIAGKDWFRSEQSRFKNQIVLWSEFTEPTKEIFIPKRVHVFPMELLASKSTSAGVQGVKVEVAKYHLGQWQMHPFEVFPGQIIGQKAEVTPKQNPVAPGGLLGVEPVRMLDTNPMGQTEPLIVDFTTPYTMVDISNLISWGSNAQRRGTYELMLYYDPQRRLTEAAIGRNNWDPVLRKDYQYVQDEMDRSVQQLNQGMGPMGNPMFPGGERML
jgi:hypothetical protein